MKENLINSAIISTEALRLKVYRQVSHRLMARIIYVFDESMASIVKYVKEIKGQLIITENDGVDMEFTRLRIVDNSASNSNGKDMKISCQILSEPAILIRGNPNIPNLQFSVYTAMKTKGDVLILVKDSNLNVNDRKSLYHLPYLELEQKRCLIGET